MDIAKSMDIVKSKMEYASKKEYLSLIEVSLLTGYSIGTLRRRSSQGLLKSYQSVKRGKLLFKRDSVEEFLKGDNTNVRI